MSRRCVAGGARRAAPGPLTIAKYVGLIMLPLAACAMFVWGIVWAVSNDDGERLSLASLFFSEPPSDEEMIYYFNDHREQFDRLLDGCTERDIEELGVLYARGGYFTIWETGNVMNSERRGYIYFDESASAEARDDASAKLQYRNIGGGWYLFTYTDG